MVPQEQSAGASQRKWHLKLVKKDDGKELSEGVGTAEQSSTLGSNMDKGH